MSPSKPFSDAELAAIINGVGQTRKLPFPAAQDSTRLRSGAASGSFPQTDTETTPADCIAFVPQDPFTRWADKDINFAEGAMPPAGGQSGPTSTIMIVLRSADQDAIARADFGYADDLPSRCSQFDLAYTESGRTSTYAVQLLAAPPIADKQYAVTQVTKPKGPGDFTSVGLRVLHGTLSLTLNLAVANLNSEADAKPALETMSELAKELISQSGKASAPTAATAPNSMTPEQMVALFKGMTGPGGEPVNLPQATVLGQSPGFTPSATLPASGSPCTFDEESYAASLSGSVYGQGQIQGATKSGYADFTAVNMPSTMGPPFPLDSRAEQLRGCTTVQEVLSEGSSRPWSSVSAPAIDVMADARYAVTYQLSDGTGEWHGRSGARKGTLSVEASCVAASEPEVRAKTEALAVFFTSVFTRAGL
ncbi:hypothetical protein [Pseudarthrobacter sp. LT1]|uniref:hypothetical protein n=1 Tax=Pseudarthrobacter sp. LT1 TaxID=3111450 RepID=UPI002D79CEAA|nr:hypothetical protein [Pseudarthrobacter sp. LT1]WRT13384.1 hypothetical protein VIK36_18875 [Pseudarthrobacter sp. LT1]